jgi:hypothetical protein
MKFIVLLIFTCLVFSGCKQTEKKTEEERLSSSKLFKDKIQQQFYVDDVETVEFVTVNFCIDNNGNTSSVKLIPKKTSYRNPENIRAIIDYRKNIKQLSDSKLRNNCYDYTFNFINTKYKNKHLDSTNYKDCEALKQGKFKYKSVVYPNTIIERTKEFQIEKEGNWFAKYKIEWETPAKYTLTYLEVSDKKSEYLIGEKIHVEIVDILENGNYVYKSNLLDRTFSVGVIQKEE